MSERLYILDVLSITYQVYHAIAEMTAPDGRPTNAVFGFVRDILHLRREKKPDYLLCAHDAPGETFRHRAYPDYKGTRPEMPADLRGQLDRIFEVLEALRIPVLEMPGLEADDLIASVAVECARRGIDAYLCTADKDMRQLIGDRVRIFDLRKNRVIDRECLLEDWGIGPEQVVDYQALVGDPVDNIPGVKGVGAKTASALLAKYKSIEGIYEHIDEVSGKKMRENLLRGRKSAMLSRELVRLKTDVPLPEDWSSWRMQPADHARLLRIFAECGFHRFADEIRAELPAAEEWKAQYILVRDEAAFEDLLRRLARADRISVDLETTSLAASSAQIVGYALAMEKGTAYYVAVRGPEGSTELDPDDVKERLRPILENPEIKKVGQNLKYDMIVLRAAGVRLGGVHFDSMIASYLLEPGERNHNLDQLSHRLLGHQTIKITELIGERGKGKEQLRMDQVPLNKVAAYAGEDADVALRLTEILEPRVREEGLWELFEEVECPLIEVLADMEFHGIRVDPARLAELGKEFTRRRGELERDIWSQAGREFNVESPTQLRQILFEELKLPVVKRTKTGPSTDQEVLEELSAEHPICALLIEHRKLSKLLGTYVETLPALLDPKDGRIHASFHQTVAATGRLSSSDPNLQNIPVRTEEGRQIRQAFLPGDDSQLLISADYSQIELRMLAYFSGDENLRAAFAADLDIHAVVGAQIEGVPLEQVNQEIRRRAKAVNFGIMYGLSPYGLARQLKIDQDEAAAFIDEYFARYPAIDGFFTRVLEGAKERGYVSTILGRRRPINGVKNTTGRVRNLPERTAINTVIQGSAADLIKKAMLAVHRRLQKDELAARLLLQIHDELVLEAPADMADSVARIVAQEMTDCMPLEGVPLKVDVGLGPNWLDLEPLELAARA